MDEIIEIIRSIEFMDGEADLQTMYMLIEKLRMLENARSVLPSMFQFFEENAANDVGSPGPFVHFIEEVADYHELLKQSIKRKPAFITVWMINRILNSNLPQRDREDWLKLLHEVSTNPAADARCREAAHDFLQYQQSE